ncbi:MAG: SGNH/GDSL hydrolase family protein [Bacteroidaceae bacterium]
MMKKAFTMALALCIYLTLGAQERWYDPLEGEVPFLCGRGWNAETGKNFQRLPERFKGKVPDAVWYLSQNSAGMSIRFLSDSKRIRVRYHVAQSVDGHRNMAPLNHSGVDLYATTVYGEQHWLGTHMKWNWKDDCVEMTWDGIAFPSLPGRGVEYTLYLPGYNTLKKMEIGIDEGCTLQFLHQSAERPIVVYGSSIIHGASPSRPGLSITNIVERHTGYPIVNLGFSGSALMEPAVFDMLGEIDARAFILDPIPNSVSLPREEIVTRAVAGVRNLRSKTDVPILLVENHPITDGFFMTGTRDFYASANASLRKAYEQLLAEGVKQLFYLKSEEIAMPEDGMIEGTHPNDLGCMAYADAYSRKIGEMLPEDKPDPRYMPVTQRRDAFYEWPVRHNEVIERNHTANPEILLIGNSITHMWGGLPASSIVNGGKAWEKTFGKRVVTNMGFGSDFIENVYWRIFHGELEGCTPSHICLLIGINNWKDSPEDVARGVVGLAALIRSRQPQAKLHVLKIYPARGLEEWVAQTNRLIEAKLPIDEMTELIDLTDCLTLPDGSGKIDPDKFVPDGLHPNEKGYAALGKRLKKHL